MKSLPVRGFSNFCVHYDVYVSALLACRLCGAVAGVDKILILEDGKLIEQGSHAELLSQNGRYADMWSVQSRSPQ